MIYQDPALVQYHIPKKQSGTTVLTFLDVTVAIDGTSGLSCGEYFNIDGIPEIYNRNGYFQITNVKHGLSENEWKTTIEASYLMKSDDTDLEEATVPTYETRKDITKIKEGKPPSDKNQIVLNVEMPPMIQDSTFVYRQKPKSLAELQNPDSARLAEYAKQQSLKAPNTISQGAGSNTFLDAEKESIKQGIESAKKLAELQKRLSNIKFDINKRTLG
jgi:hypothetical protein